MLSEEERKLRLAIYGHTDDMWRVEAHFRHIDRPIVYETDAGKRDAYDRVMKWLMSESIERILVYVNVKLYQTITVETANQPDDDTTETGIAF